MMRFKQKKKNPLPLATGGRKPPAAGAGRNESAGQAGKKFWWALLRALSAWGT
jgi:hypothetical protein